MGLGQGQDTHQAYFSVSLEGRCYPRSKTDVQPVHRRARRHSAQLLSRFSALHSFGGRTFSVYDKTTESTQTESVHVLYLSQDVGVFLPTKYCFSRSHEVAGIPRRLTCCVHLLLLIREICLQLRSSSRWFHTHNSTRSISLLLKTSWFRRLSFCLWRPIFQSDQSRMWRRTGWFSRHSWCRWRTLKSRASWENYVGSLK